MRKAAIVPSDREETPCPLAEASRVIAGIRISALSAAAVTRHIAARLDAGSFTKVAFLNAHCVNLAYEVHDYRASLDDFVVLPDGIGIDLASRLLFDQPFPENLNGTDFVPFLLGELPRGMRVGLIGAAAGVVEAAAARFAADIPQHVYLPISDGYFDEGVDTARVVEEIRAAKADIVLVALGVPRQELFIARHLTGREATVAIAVGALFDFKAGIIPRAPLMVRRLRGEWLYRLCAEPRRLWKRYILGNPQFLLHILRERRQRPAVDTL